MHIDEKILQAYQEGKMLPRDTVRMIEHIAACEECANRFSSYLLKQPLVAPPAGLRDEILAKTVQKGKTLRRKGRNTSFAAYSIRVGISVAAAILMLFLVSYNAVFSHADNVQREQAYVASVQKQEQAWLEKSEQRQQAYEERKQEQQTLSDALQKATGKVFGDLFQ